MKIEEAFKRERKAALLFIIVMVSALIFPFC